MMQRSKWQFGSTQLRDTSFQAASRDSMASELNGTFEMAEGEKKKKEGHWGLHTEENWLGNHSPGLACPHPRAKSHYPLSELNPCIYPHPTPPDPTQPHTAWSAPHGCRSNCMIGGGWGGSSSAQVTRVTLHLVSISEFEERDLSI